MEKIKRKKNHKIFHPHGGCTPSRAVICATPARQNMPRADHGRSNPPRRVIGERFYTAGPVEHTLAADDEDPTVSCFVRVFSSILLLLQPSAHNTLFFFWITHECVNITLCISMSVYMYLCVHLKRQNLNRTTFFPGAATLQSTMGAYSSRSSAHNLILGWSFYYKNVIWGSHSIEEGRL